MSEENTMENRIKDKNIWMRLLYMLLFAVFYSIAELVIAAVAVYQFLSVLFTGSKDERVGNLGIQLSAYAYQILQFQTFNTEDKPFPMADWPEAKTLTAEKDKPKAAPRKRATTRRATTKKSAPKAATSKRTSKTNKEESQAAEAKSTDEQAPE